MKGYVCLFALLFGLAMAAQTNSQSAEQEVLKTTNTWLQASQTKNIDTLKQIIADDFVGSGPGANTVDKEMITSIPEGATPFDKSKLTDLTAKVFGNTAVVFGKLSSTNPVDPAVTRFAMFYARRSGEWKMIAAQLVPVADKGEPAGQ